MARRWCWRQSDESATQPTTSSAVFTVESQHEGGQTQIEMALNDLAELLEAYVGGDLELGILDVDNFVF